MVDLFCWGFYFYPMSIQKKIFQIEEKITELCQLNTRSREDVRLLAVSKRQPQHKIEEALEAGHRLFAENRVQEAYEHWQDLKPKYPDLELHLIGPLQTNKVKEAVALFDMIHTVDREKLARKLGHEMEKQARTVPCLIQINTGEEDQKAGIAPKDFHDFLKFCTGDCHLDIKGLMCIPPIDEPAALHFALLKKMAEEHALKELSMGMSEDFEKAVPLGATYVRIGTGIFGARDL